MNHAKRNRSKIRLKRRQQLQDIREIAVVKRESEKSKLLFEKQIDKLNNEARNLRRELREIYQVRRLRRTEPGDPPKPFKSWFEIWLDSKHIQDNWEEGIKIALVDDRDFYRVDKSARMEKSEKESVEIHKIDAEQILFGALKELEEAILPMEFDRIIEDGLNAQLEKVPNLALSTHRPRMFRGYDIDKIIKRHFKISYDLMRHYKR